MFVCGIIVQGRIRLPMDCKSVYVKTKSLLRPRVIGFWSAICTTSWLKKMSSNFSALVVRLKGLKWSEQASPRLVFHSMRSYMSVVLLQLIWKSFMFIKGVWYGGFLCSQRQLVIANTGNKRKVARTTDRTLIRSEEGPNCLAAPPTAHMAQVIFSLPVAVDTIGGYNWRHRGDFWISI